MTEGQKVQWTLDLIQKLLDAKIGEPERLYIIKNTLENGNKVSDDEKNYLKEKFGELKDNPTEEPKVLSRKIPENKPSPKVFPGVNSPVTISVQVLFCFIPFISIYAFYRIKKLQKAIVIGILTFIPITAVEVLIPFPYGVILSYILSFAIPIYFIVKWSREWNEMVLNQQEEKSTPTKSPLDIIQERYAKGEITKEEFDKIKEDLA